MYNYIWHYANFLIHLHFLENSPRVENLILTGFLFFLLVSPFVQHTSERLITNISRKYFFYIFSVIIVFSILFIFPQIIKLLMACCVLYALYFSPLYIYMCLFIFLQCTFLVFQIYLNIR